MGEIFKPIARHGGGGPEKWPGVQRPSARTDGGILGSREEVGSETALTGNERSANEAMSREITVRKCESLDEFRRCVDLQREIWGEADLEVEPATMFVVAAHTGGAVVGAFRGDRSAGDTLSGCWLTRH